jgi:putative ABC transport system permease protein
MDLKVGDTLRMGVKSFVMTARLVHEPDGASGGFGFAPRTIVAAAALDGSGLLEPGSIFSTAYRLVLPAGTDLAALRSEARAHFDGAGMRWQDSRRASPGAEVFVERIGSFLVLVGLAGLAVGGVGISAAVRAWMERKTETIATLKALGASGGLILSVFALQLAVLTVIGVGIGLVLGAGGPLLAAPLIARVMPIPVEFGLAPWALAEATTYGVLVAALFTLWPLGQMRAVRAAALFRDLGPGRRGIPSRGLLAASAALLAALVAASVWFSGVPSLALGTLGGIAGALVLLAAAALILRRLARFAARAPMVRGRPGVRAALAAIGGPRSEAVAVVMSLGLGLSVLAAVGQVDAGLRAAIQNDLPERAPAYFMVDIQSDQIDAFKARVTAFAEVTRLDTAPMLRGIITRINGQPAREVAGDHWVLRGDRGITYADEIPSTTRVVAGTWWGPGYDGPPQASFAAQEAAELGLKLGDKITVNVLGRDIEAEITSFREVDFSTAGIGFVVTLNPAALAGAPHSNIATIYAPPEVEAAILRDVGAAFPNITAIRIRDAIAQVTRALDAIARATALAASVTLATGFVVLIGAAAAGERARAWEAAVLKVLGASRGRILASFALWCGSGLGSADSGYGCRIPFCADTGTGHCARGAVGDACGGPCVRAAPLGGAPRRGAARPRLRRKQGDPRGAAGSERQVPHPRAPFNGGRVQAVDIQFVPDFFEQPQFAVADGSVSRSHIAGERIGGFMKPFGQRVAHQTEQGIKPVFLFKKRIDGFCNARNAVDVIGGKYRHVVHDPLDRYQFGGADAFIRDRDRHHYRHQGVLGGKRSENLRHGGVPLRYTPQIIDDCRPVQ